MSSSLLSMKLFAGLLILSLCGANRFGSEIHVKVIKSYLPRLCGIAVATIATVVQPTINYADSSRVVGDIATSGVFFKDTLRISAFEDPKIPGITLYLSDFDRPITEKLSKDFFDDPATSSLTCAQTAKADLSSSSINTSPGGEEVFEESRNLFFKVSFYLTFFRTSPF